MLIDFAGSVGAGASEIGCSMSRFRMWLETGLRRKLISYHAICESGNYELIEIKRWNEEINNDEILSSTRSH